MATRIILKAERERSLQRRHPWVFSGAIGRVEGAPLAGDTVDVLASDGSTWLGRGAWSPASAIRCRIWTFAAAEDVDEGFFRRRLVAAIGHREAMGLPVHDRTSAFRLVYAEADGLPGIILDRYGDVIVAQFLTPGADRWKQVVAATAAALTGCRTVYARGDAEARSREGLDDASSCLLGEAPPDRVAIQEGALRFEVDVRRGHKTGFYLDQRENRALVGSWARGREVLNAFSYTGGFGVAALAGGAKRVLHVDTSADALAMARRHSDLNVPGTAAVEFLEGDVFRELRRFRDSRVSFDLIVLDPPKFADTRAQCEGAARGYKDINLLAVKLLRPGGRLFTFSCSGAMTPEFFRTVVAQAAADAGREALILGELTQAADHPCALHIPETRYLKGLHLLVR